MKIALIHLIVLSTVATSVFSKAKNGIISNAKTTLSNTTLSFTENNGQIVDQNYKPRPDVLFGGQSKGLIFHLRNNGISYQLYRADGGKEVEDLRQKDNVLDLPKRKEVDKQTIYRIDVNWLNANPHASIQKSKAQEGYDNYYTEGCPEGGALYVKSYGEVVYKNLYAGIDLKWYQKDGQLKYDYVCTAGSDYKQIQLQIEGAVELSLNSKGELVIKTPLGNIVEKAPLVMQNGKELKSKWVLKNKVIRFYIENLNSDLPYVIDPVVRVWGTYYGGAGYVFGGICNADLSGNVLLAGYTDVNTGTVIATSGSHQIPYGGGSFDAFVAKFNGNGVRLWGTHYGGSGDDFGYACCNDANGSLYLSGRTSSANGTIIATSGCHQPAYAGSDDAFLVKFNSAGVRQWGTYYGGIDLEYGKKCCTDALGNVYLTGITSSSVGTSIATIGSHQSVYGGGVRDAFLVKFNSNGVRLWGTYYGGSNYDDGSSCASDTSGNVYMCGYTQSTNSMVIATANGHQTSYGGGNTDVYIVKFNSNGVRQWGTYYGDTGNDVGGHCATDVFGNVYLDGYTNSNGGIAIASSGSHQSTFGGGTNDVFLVKFNSNGVRQWGTYYGGADEDLAGNCSADMFGNIYLVGNTASSSGTAISSSVAYQTAFGGGANDAFLVKFNSNGIRQWGTYYGGTGADLGNSCSTDASGHLYLAGFSSSNNGTAIATSNGHQSVFGGVGYNAFLVQFFECPNNNTITISSVSQNNISCNGGSNGSATLTASGGAGLTYSWNPNGGNTATASGLSAGIFTCLVTDVCGSTVSQTVSITQPNPLIVTAVTNNTIICVGNSGTLIANAIGGTGPCVYSWVAGPTNSINIISPVITTTYTVNVIDVNGCSASANVLQNVSICTDIDHQPPDNKMFITNIYPNPNTGILTLECVLSTSSGQRILYKEASVVITNTLGQIIGSEKLTNEKVALNISHLANGIYFIIVNVNNNYKTVKIVKQ